MTKKVIFLNSHPIQYFAPLYKYMNDYGLHTEAWYCDTTKKEVNDAEFGVEAKWDIPLFDGYPFKVFKNHSWKPSFNYGFFGLMNLGVIRQIFKEPKSVIIVHGWHYFTHIITIFFAKLKGHTICIRKETPQKQVELEKGILKKAKRLFFKHVLIPKVDYFLYIGTQNYLFYKNFKISEDRLIFCPYAVDNLRFQSQSNILKNQSAAINSALGIPSSHKVILFSAKYILKKRPLDLLKAFLKADIPNSWLIMVGEGELRSEMETYIQDNRMTNVILTGFVNQNEICKYYASSDVFVMCSGIGETWGLSVNEAMNFNLPVIISDLTGCSDDLVKNGQNGYTFQTGNIEDLADKLKEVLIDNKLTNTTTSIDIVKEFSYETILSNIKRITSAN